jgi:uncharacterized protein (DUF433 family)
MVLSDILADFDELTKNDIYVALSFTNDSENKVYKA